MYKKQLYYRDLKGIRDIKEITADMDKNYISSNLIDLIKIGDVVNGRIVDNVFYNTHTKEILIWFSETEFIGNSKIDSVLTKEQLMDITHNISDVERSSHIINRLEVGDVVNGRTVYNIFYNSHFKRFQIGLNEFEFMENDEIKTLATRKNIRDNSYYVVLEEKPDITLIDSISKGDLVNGKIVEALGYNTNTKTKVVLFSRYDFLVEADIKSIITKEQLKALETIVDSTIKVNGLQVIDTIKKDDIVNGRVVCDVIYEEKTLMKYIIFDNGETLINRDIRRVIPKEEITKSITNIALDSEYIPERGKSLGQYTLNSKYMSRLH